MGGKVYDRRPLVVDRDPLKQLATEVGNLKKLDPIDMLEHWVEQVRDFVAEAIKRVTGIDLLALAPFMSAIGLNVSQTPEQVWQHITQTFFNPLAWLGRIPIGALSSATPNLLAGAITNGDGVWTQDAAGAFLVTANGTTLELISERIELDVDRTVDTVVTVKYTGLTAAVGTAPIRLSWIGWNGDDEVAGGDFEIHQPVGSSSTGVTLDGTLKRLPADIWDTVSICMKVMPGATAGDLTWSGWRATRPDKLPQNLVDGLVPALDAARQTIRDLICNALGYAGTGKTDAEVIYALTNIPQAAVGGLQNFVNQASAGIQGTIDSLIFGLTGVASANNTQAELAQQTLSLALQAQAAEAAAIAAQHTLAQMNQGQNSSTGLVKNLTFSGADGDPLSGTDWAATGPTAGDLCIRSNAGVTSMGIAASKPVGRYYASSAYTHQTDDQALECVLGAGGEGGTATYLLFHCDTGFTAGGYVEMTTAGVKLGSFTQSGGTYTFSAPLATASVSLGSGHRVEVNDAGNSFELLVNNNVVAAVIDTGNTIPQGASNRSSRVLMQRSTITYNPGWPWQQTVAVDSFQLAALLISDYLPPILKSTGMRAVNTSGAAVNQGTGKISGSCFKSTAQQSHPGSWSGGAYTVPVEGLWTFEIRLQNNGDLWQPIGNTSTVAGKFQLGISVNGTVVSWGTPVTNPVGNVNDTVYFSHIDGLRDVFQLYCAAGDVVRPNLVAAPANLSVVGDAGGAGTYFSAWLGRVA